MPDLILKDAEASIEPGDDDAESPNGTFDVILSAPVKDRDGETVKPDEWEPLPDHITFDIDHGMSVASTVGSGKPTLDKDGNLRVAGTYASTRLAQDTRALVNEGHIRTTSVAFLRKSDKDSKGATTVRRELLNGAFVAIPANPAALVLSSKAADLKIGARNNASDKGSIQAIHDHAKTLGADCPAGSGGKPSGNDKPAKGMRDVKDANGTDAEPDVNGLVSDVDSTIDQALSLVADVDPASLPEPVSQALALLSSADESLDELMAALGIPDPDEESSAADGSAERPAASAAGGSADKSAADLAAAVAVRASRLRVMSALTTTED